MNENRITPSIRWLCEYRSIAEITAETLRDLDRWLCQIPYYTPPGQPPQYQVADWQPCEGGLRNLIRAVRGVTGDDQEHIEPTGVEVHWYLDMQVMIHHDRIFGSHEQITPSTLRTLDDYLTSAPWYWDGDQRRVISETGTLSESEVVWIVKNVRKMISNNRAVVLSDADVSEHWT